MKGAIKIQNVVEKIRKLHDFKFNNNSASDRINGVKNPSIIEIAKLKNYK